MNEFEKGHLIAEIIVAEKDRDLTTEEKAILHEWLQEDASNRVLYGQLRKGHNISSQIRHLESFDSDAAFDKFLSSTKKERFGQTMKNVMRVAAVLVAVVSAWFIYQTTRTELPETAQASAIAIEPGTSKAILQLADGTTLDLENQNKNIDQEEATINASDNKVVYAAKKNTILPKKISYNTISIPRAGEYQLTLSDGTEVWLNSETTLKYPVAFTGKTREVYINGEAYFHVARNEKQPFIVHTGRMDVKVLGTSFNVRAYDDEEEEQTTLVEGSVHVKTNQSATEFTMKPNQQFTTNASGGELNTVDVSSFIAWKEGRIYFEDKTIDEIMTILSRWYDINVSYESEYIKNFRFSIDMRRYDDFEKFLEIVGLTKKVKFEIDEKNIIVKREAGNTAISPAL